MGVPGYEVADELKRLEADVDHGFSCTASTAIRSLDRSTPMKQTVTGITA